MGSSQVLMNPVSGGDHDHDSYQGNEAEILKPSRTPPLTKNSLFPPNDQRGSVQTTTSNTSGSAGSGGSGRRLTPLSNNGPPQKSGSAQGQPGQYSGGLLIENPRAEEHQQQTLLPPGGRKSIRVPCSETDVDSEGVSYKFDCTGMFHWQPDIPFEAVLMVCKLDGVIGNIIFFIKVKTAGYNKTTLPENFPYERNLFSTKFRKRRFY